MVRTSASHADSMDNVNGVTIPLKDLIGEFTEFLKVDKQYAERTVDTHVKMITKFMQYVRGDPRALGKAGVRAYLRWLKENSAGNYKNSLSALKVFYRDFLDMEDVVKSFKFPPSSQRIIQIPPTEDLRTFYSELKQPMARAMFLMFATAGLRRNELLGLLRENIDLEKRMIIPGKQSSRTKRTYITFFNGEAAEVLKEILPEDPKARIFPVSPMYFRKKAEKIHKKTGVKLTPQILREWFCSELGKLGVPDRYVDGFSGRVPKSVLAKHYTDYAPKKLKRIYDKAGLKVLT